MRTGTTSSPMANRRPALLRCLRGATRSLSLAQRGRRSSQTMFFTTPGPPTEATSVPAASLGTLARGRRRPVEHDRHEDDGQAADGRPRRC